MNVTTQRLDFDGSLGAKLSARLDLPDGPITAFAIFAHCFTCSKDLFATKRISMELARAGIAVLRFDFTGLGNSHGDFASTNFSSNTQDLILAAKYLEENFEAPSLLVGHSLGGAAVLYVASDIASVKAVVTIGAPAEAEHVVHNFGAKLDEIGENGEATVSLGGREFTIRKQFLDDLGSSNVMDRVANMRKPLLVLHSPIDATVGVENASQIFLAAKHPKSYVSLDNADHLMTREKDSEFAANVISAWCRRYLPRQEPDNEDANSGQLVVTETGLGKFQNTITVGTHSLLADEPKEYGGLDSGPSPYDYLGAALGACTSMTLRMYADFKKLQLGKISVQVSHSKQHAKDCEQCTDEQKSQGGKIDSFVREISVNGEIDDQMREKLVEIANKCPVHKTLENTAHVETLVSE